MQHDLDYAGAVVGEHSFKVVYMVIAFFNKIRRRQPMDACDQHILVVGTVEHADGALARRVGVDAPEEITRLFRVTR